MPWYDRDNGEALVDVHLKSGSKVVPLRSLNVIVNVEQYVAQVEVVTIFENVESNPIEAVYVILKSFHNIFKHV